MALERQTGEITDYGEKILKAIGIVVDSKLQSLEFDITKSYTIVNNSEYKDTNKVYEVSDGNIKFKAWSSLEEKFKVGDIVYVITPINNSSEQKIIIGKKSDNKIISYDSIYSNFVEVESFQDNKELKLGCNKEDEDYKTTKAEGRINFTTSCKNYDQMLISADFKTILASLDVLKGNYGLGFTIFYKDEETYDLKKESKIEYIFDCSEFIGNPYQFENFQTQYKMVNLKAFQGLTITGVELYLYQLNNFYDKTNKRLPRQKNWPIKVSNVKIGFGFDISYYDEDQIILHVNNSNNYNKNFTKEKNYKDISLKWIHRYKISENDKEEKTIYIDGKNTSLLPKEIQTYLSQCEIQWFRYVLGSETEDSRLGTNWRKQTNYLRTTNSSSNSYYKVDSQFDSQEKIVKYNVSGLPIINNNEAEITNSIPAILKNNYETQEMKWLSPLENYEINFPLFNYTLIPNHEIAQEQIRVIIQHYNDSGEIDQVYLSEPKIFTNDLNTEVANALKIYSELELVCSDNSDGIYYNYDQSNSLITDGEQNEGTKKLVCYFDPNLSGNPTKDTTGYKKIQWIIPRINSMLIFNDFWLDGIYSIDEIDKNISLLNNQNSISKFNITSGRIGINEDGYVKKYYNVLATSNIEILQEENIYQIGQKESQGQVLYYYINLLSGETFLDNYVINMKLSSNTLLCIEKNDYTISESESIMNFSLNYGISTRLNIDYTNNLIKCNLFKERKSDLPDLTALKKFEFGNKGTQGASSTLVLSVLPEAQNYICYKPNGGNLSEKNSMVVEARLYDENNKIVGDTANLTYSFSWYEPYEDSIYTYKNNNGEIDKNYQKGLVIEKTKDKNKCIIMLSLSDLVTKQSFLESVNILQCVVQGYKNQTLVSYIVIPKCNEVAQQKGVSYATGTSRIVYDGSETVTYSKDSYRLYNYMGNEVEPTEPRTWRVIDESAKALVDSSNYYNMLGYYYYNESEKRYTKLKGEKAQIYAFLNSANGKNSIYGQKIDFNLPTMLEDQQWKTINLDDRAKVKQEIMNDNTARNYQYKKIIEKWPGIGKKKKKVQSSSEKFLPNLYNYYVVQTDVSQPILITNEQIFNSYIKGNDNLFKIYNGASYIVDTEYDYVPSDKDTVSYIIDSESENSVKVEPIGKYIVWKIPLEVSDWITTNSDGLLYGQNLNQIALLDDPSLESLQKEILEYEKEWKLSDVIIEFSNLPLMATQCVMGGIENRILDSNKELLYEYIDYDNQAVWQQPILLVKNTYFSSTINLWDGKTLGLNEQEGYVLSKMLAAGKKNEENEFTGVLLGDWTADINKSPMSINTGLYGFKDGALCFSFKDDGTATIGKQGQGQIKFDGNVGNIQSSLYEQTSGQRGMSLDFINGILTACNYDSSRNLSGYIKLNASDETIYSYDSLKGYYKAELEDEYLDKDNYIFKFDVNNKKKYKDQRTEKYYYIDNNNYIVDELGNFINLEGYELNDNEKPYQIIKTIGYKKLESGFPLQIGKDPNNINFSVDWNGNLNAKNGRFNGHIEATSGTIEGILKLSGEKGILQLDYDKNSSDNLMIHFVKEESEVAGSLGVLKGNDKENVTTNIGLQTYKGGNTGIIFSSATNAKMHAANGVYLDANPWSYAAEKSVARIGVQAQPIKEKDEISKENVYGNIYFELLVPKSYVSTSTSTDIIKITYELIKDIVKPLQEMQNNISTKFQEIDNVFEGLELPYTTYVKTSNGIFKSSFHNEATVEPDGNGLQETIIPPEIAPANDVKEFTDFEKAIQKTIKNSLYLNDNNSFRVELTENILNAMIFFIRTKINGANNIEQGVTAKLLPSYVDKDKKYCGYLGYGYEEILYMQIRNYYNKNNGFANIENNIETLEIPWVNQINKEDIFNLEIIVFMDFLSGFYNTVLQALANKKISGLIFNGEKDFEKLKSYSFNETDKTIKTKWERIENNIEISLNSLIHNLNQMYLPNSSNVTICYHDKEKQYTWGEWLKDSSIDDCTKKLLNRFPAYGGNYKNIDLNTGEFLSEVEELKISVPSSPITTEIKTEEITISVPSDHNGDLLYTEQQPGKPDFLLNPQASGEVWMSDDKIVEMINMWKSLPNPLSNSVIKMILLLSLSLTQWNSSYNSYYSVLSNDPYLAYQIPSRNWQNNLWSYLTYGKLSSDQQYIYQRYGDNKPNMTFGFLPIKLLCTDKGETDFYFWKLKKSQDSKVEIDYSNSNSFIYYLSSEINNIGLYYDPIVQAKYIHWVWRKKFENDSSFKDDSSPEEKNILKELLKMLDISQEKVLTELWNWWQNEHDKFTILATVLKELEEPNSSTETKDEETKTNFEFSDSFIMPIEIDNFKVEKGLESSGVKGLYLVPLDSEGKIVDRELNIRPSAFGTIQQWSSKDGIIIQHNNITENLQLATKYKVNKGEIALNPDFKQSDTIWTTQHLGTFNAKSEQSLYFEIGKWVNNSFKTLEKQDLENILNKVLNITNFNELSGMSSNSKNKIYNTSTPIFQLQILQEHVYNELCNFTVIVNETSYGSNNYTPPGSFYGSSTVGELNGTGILEYSNKIAKKAAEAFRSWGANDACVAGMLANMFHECSFNPNAFGNDTNDYQSAGIFCWNSKWYGTTGSYETMTKEERNKQLKKDLHVDQEDAITHQLTIAKPGSGSIYSITGPNSKYRWDDIITNIPEDFFNVNDPMKGSWMFAYAFENCTKDEGDGKNFYSDKNMYNDYFIRQCTAIYFYRKLGHPNYAPTYNDFWFVKEKKGEKPKFKYEDGFYDIGLNDPKKGWTGSKRINNGWVDYKN